MGVWEKQENRGEETECLTEGDACKCMWGAGVLCMPVYALASHVRVSLSVYESLQQMPPLFLADHLTPLQPWNPPCVSGAGPWEEEWVKEAGGLDWVG